MKRIALLLIFALFLNLGEGYSAINADLLEIGLQGEVGRIESNVPLNTFSSRLKIEKIRTSNSKPSFPLGSQFSSLQREKFSIHLKTPRFIQLRVFRRQIVFLNAFGIKFFYSLQSITQQLFSFIPFRSLIKRLKRHVQKI